jgi:formate dehydrogenase major subunit
VCGRSCPSSKADDALLELLDPASTRSSPGDSQPAPARPGHAGRGPGEPIRVTARADRAVAEGMVFIPFCYAEAAANLLTNHQLDPFGKIPEYKFCAARVEKATASAEAAE